MMNSADAVLADVYAAANDLMIEWGNGGTIDDIAGHLNCTEVDQMIRLCKALGRKDAAVALAAHEGAEGGSYADTECEDHGGHDLDWS